MNVLSAIHERLTISQASPSHLSALSGTIVILCAMTSIQNDASVLGAPTAEINSIVWCCTRRRIVIMILGLFYLCLHEHQRVKKKTWTLNSNVGCSFYWIATFTFFTLIASQHPQVQRNWKIRMNGSSVSGLMFPVKRKRNQRSLQLQWVTKRKKTQPSLRQLGLWSVRQCHPNNHLWKDRWVAKVVPQGRTSLIGRQLWLR